MDEVDYQKMEEEINAGQVLSDIEDLSVRMEEAGLIQYDSDIEKTTITLPYPLFAELIGYFDGDE